LIVHSVKQTIFFLSECTIESVDLPPPGRSPKSPESAMIIVVHL